jgi:hypothetical protein
MKCRRVRHLLLDFVDGLGNEALHAEVERHLAQCKECETFAAESTRSLAFLRRAPVEPLDENFNWKVRLAIHREQKAGAKHEASAGTWVRAWNFRYVASTGVAFAFVLVAGVVAVNRIAPSGPSLPSASRESTTPSTSEHSSIAENHTTRSMVPSRGTFAPNRQGSVLVSNRGTGSVDTAQPAARGAIDRFAEENAIDSLIDAHLVGLTPEMRDRIIQRQIHWLESQQERERQLQRQPASAPRP